MAIEKEIIVNVDTSSGTNNVKKLNDEIADTGKEAKKSQADMKGLAGTIDNITGGAITKFKGMQSGVSMITKGFGALRGAIIATGLGLLLVIVGSLIEYFKNFEGGVKIVTTITNLLGDTIAAIVDNAKKLLTLDFKGFFGGVADAMEESIDATNDLFDSQEKLYELNKKFIGENARLNASIESQGRIVRDTTKSFDERLKAQKELDRLSEVLISNERELTEAELDRLKAEARLENNYEKRRELEIEIEQTMANLIDTESRLQAQRDKAGKAQRQIVEEQKKQIEDENKARAEALKKRQDEAKKRAEAIAQEKKAIQDIEAGFVKRQQDLEDKTAEQKLERERTRALADLEKMKGQEADKAKAREEILEFYEAREKELQLKKDEENLKLEEDRLKKIQSVRDEFAKRIEDAQAETEIEKIELEQERKLAELEALNASEEQKFEVRKFYSDKLNEQREKDAEEEKKRDRAVANAKVSIAETVFDILGSLAKKGSAIAKGIAVAQATINTYQGITAALSAQSVIPDPIGSALKFANAAFVGVQGFLNVKKILSTKEVSAGGASGGGDAGSIAPPPAPSFNLVQGTGSNQIAESLGGQNRPIQAFVVSTAVTSQQEMDRNIEENATWG